MLQLARSILLLFLLFQFGALTAQDDNQTECPYFTIDTADETEVDFFLLSTDINATISGVIANVEIQQVYVNDGEAEVDATYVFPMSTNAAVYGMEMIMGDGTVIVAEIKRKDEAQEIFDEANEAGQTASLLEQNRPNVFQMSLANIQPGESLTVKMVYTELLVPEQGVYQFVFPNVVGPRFSFNNESWIEQSIAQAEQLSATAFNINVDINAGMPFTANNPSHGGVIDYSGNSASTLVSSNPGADYILNYTLDDDNIETGLLLYEGEEENFFLSMIQPPKPDVMFDSPPREYIFIMDISGSMNGTPLSISKAMITDLLHDLNSDDMFNILFFAGGSSVLSPNSLPATEANITDAVNFLTNVNSAGSTHLLPAMEQALSMGGTNGFARTFAIITDGFVAVEKEAYDLIRENLNKANFFAFGIGNNVNRFIIEGIAYVGEGESFVATNFNDAGEVADRFKEYIENPVLTNIEATFNGIDAYDIEPVSIPDVFADRPIIICGKYHGAPAGSINLKGDFAYGEVSTVQSFGDYTEGIDDNIALKYLWARKKIKLMSDYGIASNEDDEVSIEEEITQLGLHYSLVTDYTSFVAVNDDAVAAEPDTPDSSGNGGINSSDGDGIPDFIDTDSDSDSVATSIESNFNTSYGTSKKGLISVLGNVLGADNRLRVELNLPEQLLEESMTLLIVDATGKTIYRQDINRSYSEELVTLLLEELQSGMYFISLVSASEFMDTDRFIVK